MHLNKLSRSELVAVLGGLLLVVSLFLTWFATKGKGVINGAHGDFSAWDLFAKTRILLLLAGLVPLILAYIIARNHELSWPRGEATAVIAVFAFGLVLYNGVVSRPGTSNQLVSLQLGYFLAILGTLLMLAGSAVRASGTERKRKPPGVI